MLKSTTLSRWHISQFLLSLLNADMKLSGVIIVRILDTLKHTVFSLPNSLNVVFMNLETLFAPLGLRVNLSALTADPTKMLFRSISDRPKSGTTKKQPSIKYVSVRLHAQNAWGRAIPSPSSGPITFTYLWLLRIVLALKYLSAVLTR